MEGKQGKVRGDILCGCYHLNYKITEGIESSFIYSAFTNTKFTLNGVSIPSPEPLSAEFLPRTDFYDCCKSFIKKLLQEMSEI